MLQAIEEAIGHGASIATGMTAIGVVVAGLWRLVRIALKRSAPHPVDVDVTAGSPSKYQQRLEQDAADLVKQRHDNERLVRENDRKDDVIRELCLRLAENDLPFRDIVQ